PWTRSFLGATDLGRDRAGEHDGRLLPQCRGPQGRDLEETTGAVRSSRVRRLRRRQGDRGGRRAGRRSPARRAVGPAAGARLDVFHTTMEAHRVLAQSWRRAEAAWEQAEAADAPVARAKQQGIDARGAAGAARAAWGKATASFQRAEHLESAWDRAHAALDLFRRDGQLNDRTWAAAEIAAALKDLPGPEWAKVRNFLTDRGSLAFLDRLHRRWESAEPRPEWCAAMAWRWWLRHRRPRSSDPLTELVRAVGRDRALTPEEQASYDRVAAVLGDTFRASS